MALPRYQFKSKTLPDFLRLRVFEEVRGAFESIDGKVFVTPKNPKDVFEKERVAEKASRDSLSA